MTPPESVPTRLMNHEDQTLLSDGHPDDVSRILAAIEARFERLVLCKVEFRMRRKDGQSRGFASRGQAERDESGLRS